MPSKKLFLASTILIVLITLPLIGSVGASSEMWSQTYGGTSSDSAHAMVQTSDGGFALAGYTRSFGAGSYDFWMVKTDGYGNVEWNQTYGGAGIDRAYALVETSDGGFALAGATTHFGILAVPYSDFWLVKTDANGNVEWNQTYAKAETDIARSLVVKSDGGYALAGYTAYSPGIRHDFWLVKTDGYGNVEWNQTYGGSGMDEAYSLVVTSDGGYALAGGGPLVKTDSYGNMEWNQTCG